MQEQNSTNPVTIVVPIYADLPSIKECLDSLKAHVDISINKVILVNDCGPDVDDIEKYIKSAIEGFEGFSYYRNPQNLGFVGTCNRAALELDKTDNDILLLNSDTIVTEGFLEELSAVLYANSDIGVVSPRTNNATIATIPLAAARYKGIGAKESYKLFQKLKPHMPRYNIVPVAHGFCILIRRSLIKEYGLFDTIFGKGYGEEVDFCMRIKEGGYKCALSNWSYVFHSEAKSFGLEAKAELLEEGDRIIRQRYPKYHEMISSYMKRAIEEERAIFEKAGIKPHELELNKLKKLIKRNQMIYSLLRKLKAIIKR
ncbi:MAG: glycosyltransferase family 2 protein [Candidatus Saccharimonadales bacterium]